MIFFIITMLAMNCESLSLRIFKLLCMVSGIEVVLEALSAMAILVGIFR